MGILQRIFGEQRSIGKWWAPSHPCQSAPVTVDNFPGITAALCAVRVIAESFADVPLEVVENVGGQKRVIEDHELAWRWNVEPNPYMTGYTFRETVMYHLLTWGNAYIDYDILGNGTVERLTPLLPNRLNVKQDQSGDLVYEVTRYPSLQRDTLRADDLLHVKNLSVDGLVGLSPVQVARQSLQLTANCETFGAGFFANNCRPGGALKHPNRLSDKARENLKASWEGMHAGAEKGNRLAILEEGMDFVQYAIPPEDSQFLQTRQFQIAEICRIYNIAPVFVHDLGRATWGNLETLNTLFVQRTLMPWLRKCEQEIDRRLVPGRNLTVRFNVDALLRGDVATRFAVYVQGLQNGIFSVNEVRAKENMPPIEGGDEHRVPGNQVAATPEQQPQADKPTDEQDDQPTDEQEVPKDDNE